MTRYLLDTNIASAIVRGDDPGVRDRLVQIPVDSVFLSVVTEAEMQHGLAKRGNPDGLARRVAAFLETVTVLSWTSNTSLAYGQLRAAIERDGLSLAPLDMMIAAHAHSESAVLVSRDRAFSNPNDYLSAETWNSGG